MARTKRKMDNISISKSDFEVMDFDDKKFMLMDTYPFLEFDDMSEDEFDEYFNVDEEE